MTRRTSRTGLAGALPAAQVAELLGTTTTAVNSGLRRARAQLAETLPSEGDLAEPTAPDQRAVLDRFAAAFENADTRALAELLRAYRADAVTVPTVTTTGIARIVTFRNPALFALFGLPMDYGAAPAGPQPAHDPAVPPWPWGCTFDVVLDGKSIAAPSLAISLSRA